MASNGPERRDGAAGHAPAKKNWIPWIIGALVLLAILIFGLRGCDDTAEQAQVDPAAETGQVAAPGTAGDTLGAAAGGIGSAGTAAFTGAGLRGYLQEPGMDQAGRAFALEQVTFDSGSSTLDATDQGSLAEAATVLKEFPNAGVTITSYADPAGDAAANKKLAAARAVSVKNALATAGVPAARLMTNVVGETGSAAIAANRRVELLVQRR